MVRAFTVFQAPATDVGWQSLSGREKNANCATRFVKAGLV